MCTDVSNFKFLATFQRVLEGGILLPPPTCRLGLRNEKDDILVLKNNQREDDIFFSMIIMIVFFEPKS